MLRCALTVGRFIAASIIMIESDIQYTTKSFDSILRANRFSAYSVITIASLSIAVHSMKYNYDQLFAATSILMYTSAITPFLPNAPIKLGPDDSKTILTKLCAALAAELAVTVGSNIICKKEAFSDITSGYYVGYI